jgi:hypothetical protein
VPLDEEIFKHAIGARLRSLRQSLVVDLDFLAHQVKPLDKSASKRLHKMSDEVEEIIDRLQRARHTVKKRVRM